MLKKISTFNLKLYKSFQKIKNNIKVNKIYFASLQKLLKMLLKGNDQTWTDRYSSQRIKDIPMMYYGREIKLGILVSRDCR